MKTGIFLTGAVALLKLTAALPRSENEPNLHVCTIDINAPTDLGARNENVATVVQAVMEEHQVYKDENGIAWTTVVVFSTLPPNATPSVVSQSPEAPAASSTIELPPAVSTTAASASKVPEQPPPKATQQPVPPERLVKRSLHSIRFNLVLFSTNPTSLKTMIMAKGATLSTVETPFCVGPHIDNTISTFSFPTSVLAVETHQGHFTSETIKISYCATPGLVFAPFVLFPDWFLAIL